MELHLLGHLGVWVLCGVGATFPELAPDVSESHSSLDTLVRHRIHYPRQFLRVGVLGSGGRFWFSLCTKLMLQLPCGFRGIHWKLFARISYTSPRDDEGLNPVLR